jgi:hypothetical protein
MRGQLDILHGSAGKYYGMHFGAAKSPFDERDPVRETCGCTAEHLRCAWQSKPDCCPPIQGSH